jgi:regulator of protease activity HflC (stomatin/prohibitin superfamily)
MNITREKKALTLPGILALVLILGLLAWGGLQLRDFVLEVTHGRFNAPALLPTLLYGVGAIVLGFILTGGFLVVQPNEARVLTFLGKYTGSVTRDGWYWVNPFAKKQKLSLKVNNFNSERLKVNDAMGNPIEIAAVIVWRVTDSARATFDVEDYQEFVGIQSETAIRALASRYPYDTHDETESLRGNPDEVGEELRKELHKRLEIAGIDVLEARISHLAYAPEIAQAMLRRQQAQAVIAARQKIVEGAVGMVKQALAQLKSEGVVELDEERKAAMVNNLLVALVSESEASPVINTGSLY